MKKAAFTMPLSTLKSLEILSGGRSVINYIRERKKIAEDCSQGHIDEIILVKNNNSCECYCSHCGRYYIK